ncbi:Vacuolar H+-ATPase V1 sector, subunit G [Handroanthus impetiginosus]|uniref:Vacuolar H+-ATPase V1 sector, subunit G n=1 Tax=Handroanthus impetiginosus TaxID=429701 RepID=A0A2G9HE07_9LAMI|nr:Vacuolar H+-ATPase V1 sector, subunit G [Handroanthus impetiginosus]
MCILCVVQKWSRRIATILPWLVIPLIGLWGLSQLLPPALRFEITSPRLACVLVLLVTLFWYEVLMPQLSAWRVRRNARLRERKRFEAIELQKLRKTATRRCRNCLTAYRDQNPGGGKFMCSYCGHISKRPVLDFRVPPGMGDSGILRDLVGKGGKILNGKAWSDNGWICGQDWLENGNWGGGPFSGKSSYWKKNDGGFFGRDDDNCLTEKSYSRVFIFACKAVAAFFLGGMWLWRKIFRVSSSTDDASADAERGGLLDGQGENGVTGQESRGEKARRKAEEKRLARLEKELLEEEERKQREEVARLVEERRRLRDAKMEAEKERGKGSPRAKERDSKKESEKKRQERKKEKDKGSCKSNSDAEDLEKRAGKESDRNKKSESDGREQHRSSPETLKAHGTELGHGFKSAAVSNHNRANVGTRYLDRMRGTFLSSSRAFTGGGFFGKSNNASVVPREHKPSTLVETAQTSTYRKEMAQPDRVSGRSTVNRDDKSANRTVLIEPQTCTAPKKSWQQLFTRSSAVSPSNSNVISRPTGKHKAEVQSPPFSGHPTSTQSFDNPINFGLQSPFSLPSSPFGSSNSSMVLPLPSESMLPKLGDSPHQLLPEESEIFEDPCYVPDPISLLGPVSESLDNFQLDLGFVTDTGLEKPNAVKSRAAPSEITKPSPIQSPLSRPRVSEERHASSFLRPSSPKAQVSSNNINDAGTWQMWNSTPLGQDGLGLVGGPISWLSQPETNLPNKEDNIHPVPQRTMASLFKKDEQAISGSHPSQNAFFGNSHNGGAFNTSGPAIVDGPWLPRTSFGLTSTPENQTPLNPKEEAVRNGLAHGYSNGSVANHHSELSAANSWAKKDWNVQGSRDGIGNSMVSRPHIGGLYSPPDVQSLWSYD